MQNTPRQLREMQCSCPSGRTGEKGITGTKTAAGEKGITCTKRAAGDKGINYLHRKSGR